MGWSLKRHSDKLTAATTMSTAAAITFLLIRATVFCYRRAIKSLSVPSDFRGPAFRRNPVTGRSHGTAKVDYETRRLPTMRSYETFKKEEAHLQG